MSNQYLQELRDSYHILTGNFAPGNWSFADLETEIKKQKESLIQQIESGETPQMPDEIFGVKPIIEEGE